MSQLAPVRPLPRTSPRRAAPTPAPAQGRGAPAGAGQRPVPRAVRRAAARRLRRGADAQHRDGQGLVHDARPPAPLRRSSPTPRTPCGTRIDGVSGPGPLAQRARALGMVPAATPAFLRLSDGKVLGVAKKAKDDSTFSVVTEAKAPTRSTPVATTPAPTAATPERARGDHDEAAPTTTHDDRGPRHRRRRPPAPRSPRSPTRHPRTDRPHRPHDRHDTDGESRDPAQDATALGPRATGVGHHARPRGPRPAPGQTPKQTGGKAATRQHGIRQRSPAPRATGRSAGARPHGARPSAGRPAGTRPAGDPPHRRPLRAGPRVAPPTPPAVARAAAAAAPAGAAPPRAAAPRPATRAAGCASSPSPACSCSASSAPSSCASRASTPPRSPRRPSSSARRPRSSRRCAGRCSPPTARCWPRAWCARSSSPTSRPCAPTAPEEHVRPGHVRGGRAAGGDQARPAAQHHGLRAGARAHRHQPLPHPQPRRHPADLEHHLRRWASPASTATAARPAPSAPTRRARTTAALVGYMTGDGKPGGGVELMMREAPRRARPGKQTFEQGRDGTIIPVGESSLVPAVDGNDVTLTINSSLQWYAQNALAQRIKETKATSGHRRHPGRQDRQPARRRLVPLLRPEHRHRQEGRPAEQRGLLRRVRAGVDLEDHDDGRRARGGHGHAVDAGRHPQPAAALRRELQGQPRARHASTAPWPAPWPSRATSARSSSARR